jgi:L-threonylcarbamoyladenylate synthase
MEDLEGRINGVLDGGETGIGLESTVVRVLGNQLYILRSGGITREQLQEAIGTMVEVIAQEDQTAATESEFASNAVQSVQTPRSPGVKYAHYAPKGEMLLVTGNQSEQIAVVKRKIDEARQQGRLVGVLSCTEHIALYEADADAVFNCGPFLKPEKAAQSLYAILRECDERGLDFIVAEGYPELGIGAALMNRLRKAAGGREIRV